MNDENEDCCCEWHGRHTTVKDYDGIYEVFYCPICGKHTTKLIEEYEG